MLVHKNSRFFKNTAGMEASWFKHVANSLRVIFGLWLANRVVCTILFYWKEDYSLGDCLYWSSTTASTTGYGDILPTMGYTKSVTSWYMESNFWLTLFLGALVIAYILFSRQAAHDDQKTDYTAVVTGHIYSELVRSGQIRPLPEGFDFSAHADQRFGGLLESSED